MPPSYIWVRAVVWAYGHGQTDRHTDTQARVTTIHFASSTAHAKCNQLYNREIKLQLCNVNVKLQIAHAGNMIL